MKSSRNRGPFCPSGSQPLKADGILASDRGSGLLGSPSGTEPSLLLGQDSARPADYSTQLQSQQEKRAQLQAPKAHVPSAKTAVALAQSIKPVLRSEATWLLPALPNLEDVSPLRGRLGRSSSARLFSAGTVSTVGHCSG